MTAEIDTQAMAARGVTGSENAVREWWKTATHRMAFAPGDAGRFGRHLGRLFLGTDDTDDGARGGRTR